MKGERMEKSEDVSTSAVPIAVAIMVVLGMTLLVARNGRKVDRLEVEVGRILLNYHPEGKAEARPNAILPGHRSGGRVKHLMPGESGWTVPWALVVDDERRCWIRPGYVVHDSPGGTATMEVGCERGGYWVGLPPEVSYDPGPVTRGDLLPVVRLVPCRLGLGARRELSHDRHH